MKRESYKWVVVAIFFAFMLLHQTDRLLINTLVPSIMADFQITRTEMGLVYTGALLVGAVLYPIWGYLYDRYARSKLLALASLLWGVTTWFSALVPSSNYGLFVGARASTGIDDSSYPGLYSLVADYFKPNTRGKIFGLLQISQPLGYLLGLILGLILATTLGWRNIFFITGTLGIVVGVLIFFNVRDVPRGSAEPELEGLAEETTPKFNSKAALSLLKKPTLLPLFAQGFFGVFPWQVINAWFFDYLQTERGYAPGDVFPIMLVAILALASAYFIGGTLGDFLFKRTQRGRLIVCVTGVIMGAVLLLATVNLVPIQAYGGVGADVTVNDQGQYILTVSEGRSAYTQGARTGDILLSVNGAAVEGLTAEQATQLLRGEVGKTNDQANSVTFTGVHTDGAEYTISPAFVNIDTSGFGEKALFTFLLSATALFIPLSAPNVVATVYDVTVPEVRSTAYSIQYFIEQGGSAIAPVLAGAIADMSSLSTAIPLICVGAWILCAIFLAIAIFTVPKDIAALREEMRQRAAQAHLANDGEAKIAPASV